MRFATHLSAILLLAAAATTSVVSLPGPRPLPVAPDVVARPPSSLNLTVSSPSASNTSTTAPRPIITPSAGQPLPPGAFGNLTLPQLGDELQGLLDLLLAQAKQGATQLATCPLCLSLLSGLRAVADLGGEAGLVALLGGACSATKALTQAECAALAQNQGPPLYYMIRNIDPVGPQGQEFCYGAIPALGLNLELCPAVAPKGYRVAFPKPRPAKVNVPARTGRTFKLLHISDWHVDFEYKAGSEAQCDALLCCRGLNASATTAARAANEWGDYNCDAPRKLAENLLDNVVPVSGQPDFAIFTGDIDPHDVPFENRTVATSTLTGSYGILHSKLDAKNIKLLPAIGNHDMGPTNQFPFTQQQNPPSNQWLYDLLSQSWNGWIDAAALQQVKTNGHGSYSVHPPNHPKLRVLSVNTVLSYHVNFYVYPALQKVQDPSNLFAWMVKELQAAEDAGERVWIIMHVPPTNIDATPDFSESWAQIIRRYNETIAAQFSGHTHRDEFAVTYSFDAAGFDPRLQARDAVSTMYIGPSVVPYTELNPGWRTYDVDTGSYEIMDARTYVADLSLAPTWSRTRDQPSWSLEYSARDAYGGASPSSPSAWPSTEPLTPAFWHRASQSILSEPTTWSRYFLYRSKSSGRDGKCPFGSACQLQVSFDLRAGTSQFYANPSTVKRRSGGVEARDARDEGRVARRDATEEFESQRNDVSGQHHMKRLCAPHFGSAFA